MAGNRIPGPWRGVEESALVGGGPPVDRPTFPPVRAAIGGLVPETSALASLRIAWNMDGKPFFPGPQDLLDQVLKQLMGSSTVTELLEHIERLLGPTSFAAGVVYGAGESVVLSVVELLDLLKTFVLAELYDKVNGLPAAGQSSDPGIAGRIYNFAGAIWGRFVSELLKPAAEERDEILREVARIFEDPMAFFGNVAEQYQDKYRHFKVLVSDHSLQSQFEAGKIFGEILLEVILLFIAGAGAVKTAAKAPKLLKLAKRLKGKIERKPRKILGGGDGPPRPPSSPPPQTRPKPQLKEAKPDADSPPAAAAVAKKPGPVEMDPNSIRYSQKSISYAKKREGMTPYTYDDIVASMKKDGWTGDPIDVVEMPDGKITSIDNTRVSAAREAGIPAKVNVRGANDPLPPDMATRFPDPNRPGEYAKTWGEAAENRITKQGPVFSSESPQGTLTDPKLTGKPK